MKNITNKEKCNGVYHLWFSKKMQLAGTSHNTDIGVLENDEKVEVTLATTLSEPIAVWDDMFYLGKGRLSVR